MTEQINVGAISEALNNKADRDLNNLNASGKSLASGWSMPSSRYINLTLGASGATYTAPANGWFVINCNNMVANGTVYFANATSGIYSPTVRNAWAGGVMTNNIMAKKGDVVYINYDGINMSESWNYFRFIYAEGESNV